MTGAVGQQRVPKGFLENYAIILPSFKEQIRIVRMLDDCFDKELQVKEADIVPEIEDYFEEPEEEVVKRKELFLKPMDEEEAITQMELLGHTFFVFKNMDNDKICVVYKRKDGAYGVLETN